MPEPRQPATACSACSAALEALRQRLRIVSDFDDDLYVIRHTTIANELRLRRIMERLSITDVTEGEIDDADNAADPPDAPAVAAETLARAFHETYERLAPSFGYRTREASAVPWESVPEPNKSLMIAVAREVLAGRSVLRLGKSSSADLNHLRRQEAGDDI